MASADILREPFARAAPNEQARANSSRRTLLSSNIPRTDVPRLILRELSLHGHFIYRHHKKSRQYRASVKAILSFHQGLAKTSDPEQPSTILRQM
jgi:hypothetical protein